MIKKRKLNGNCKGNAIIDSILIFLIIVAVAFTGIITYKFFGDINTDLQDDDMISASNKQIIQDSYNRFPSVMDGLFLLIFILLWIVAIVFSFLIDSHPIFYLFVIILIVFVIIVSAIMSNAFEDFTQEEDFVSVADNFPITLWIMNHITIIACFIGFSIIIALYGKNRILGGGI